MRLLIALLLFISASVMGQQYFETTLFDVSGITGDTITSISWKEKDPGVNIKIDFSDVDCDLLSLGVGYGPDDFSPSFIDTIPGVQLPVVLDKTTYTATYKGVETNTVSFDISWYDDNYLWFQIIDNAACTSGEIKVRMKRK